MGNAKMILKLIEMTLEHASDIIDLAENVTEDVKQVGESIKRLHAEVKEKGKGA